MIPWLISKLPPEQQAHYRMARVEAAAQYRQIAEGYAQSKHVAPVHERVQVAATMLFIRLMWGLK